MNGPSPNLSWRELACKDVAKTPYPEQWRKTRAVTLAVEFEKIRAQVGRPITIGSAYRTVVHNKSVGGVPQSQHVQGRALDLYPPYGWSLDRFYAVIRSIANRDDSAIYGVGLYPTFVHIDVRPITSSGKLVVWHGTRSWAEPKQNQ